MTKVNKSFRLDYYVTKYLEELSAEYGLNQTEIIEKAVEHLYKLHVLATSVAYKGKFPVDEKIWEEHKEECKRTLAEAGLRK